MLGYAPTIRKRFSSPATPPSTLSWRWPIFDQLNSVEVPAVQAVAAVDSQGKANDHSFIRAGDASE